MHIRHYPASGNSGRVKQPQKHIETAASNAGPKAQAKVAIGTGVGSLRLPSPLGQSGPAVKSTVLPTPPVLALAQGQAADPLRLDGSAALFHGTVTREDGTVVWTTEPPDLVREDEVSVEPPRKPPADPEVHIRVLATGGPAEQEGLVVLSDGTYLPIPRFTPL